MSDEYIVFNHTCFFDASPLSPPDFYNGRHQSKTHHYLEQNEVSLDSINVCKFRIT